MALLTLTHTVLYDTDTTDHEFKSEVIWVLVTGGIGLVALFFAFYLRWPKATMTVVAAAGAAVLVEEAVRHEQHKRDAEQAKALADELERRDRSG